MNDSMTKHGQITRDKVIALGLELWRDDPASVTARGIGNRLGMKHSGVLYHFGSIAALKDAIAREAVRIKDEKIVPGLIVSRHPAVAWMSGEDRQRFLTGF